MRNILKKLLVILEYIALFIVGYYGIKYVFVAGPIYFGSPWGYIVGGVIVCLFVFQLLKKENVFKYESNGIKGIKQD